jgi:hypothetical protein
MLKQKIEDCCSAADKVGADGKKELGRVLDNFNSGVQPGRMAIMMRKIQSMFP